jgi:hypothetical protein
MGCSDGSGDPGGDAAVQADADPDQPDSGDPDPGGFTTLISRSWSIPAGQEVYRCARLTVEEDVYITTFRALAPQGTHHTVLSVRDNPTQPDGEYDCSASSIAHSMLFASGVGTDDLLFPQGVAIPVRAGQQLELNLHLYNVGDAAITGTSGTLARLIPAAEVEHQAEVVFGGQYLISLSPDAQNEQTVNGGCQFEQDATVLALWPHMHQLGRHTKVVHESGAGNVTLLDAPFDFSEQVNHVIDPVQVAAGERFAIACTYLNDTGRLVTFGDSSEQEMCFVGIYRYPATGAGVFSCAQAGF